MSLRIDEDEVMATCKNLIIANFNKAIIQKKFDQFEDALNLLKKCKRLYQTYIYDVDYGLGELQSYEDFKKRPRKDLLHPKVLDIYRIMAKVDQEISVVYNVSWERLKGLF